MTRVMRASTIARMPLHRHRSLLVLLRLRPRLVLRGYACVGSTCCSLRQAQENLFQDHVSGTPIISCTLYALTLVSSAFGAPPPRPGGYGTVPTPVRIHDAACI